MLLPSIHAVFTGDEEEDDKVPHVEGDNVDQAASISDGSEDDEDDDEDEADVESDMESGSEDESGSELDEDSDGSGPDLARGKGNVETSSDEDDDDDVEAILKHEEEEIQHDWGELCKDAPRSEEVRSRTVSQLSRVTSSSHFLSSSKMT